MGYPSIVGLTQRQLLYNKLCICNNMYCKNIVTIYKLQHNPIIFFSELLVDLEFSASCNFLVFWMQLHVAVTNSVHAQEEAVEMFHHDDYGSGRIHTG